MRKTITSVAVDKVFSFKRFVTNETFVSKVRHKICWNEQKINKKKSKKRKKKWKKKINSAKNKNVKFIGSK